MKLSNKQIEALANKIISELEAPYLKYNKDIENSSEYINFTSENKDCKELFKIASKYSTDYDSCYSVVGFIKSAQSLIKTEYFKDKFLKIPRLNLSDVENEITLATIECDNLDSLIESIKSKFTKPL